jgi:hypothetical protein
MEKVIFYRDKQDEPSDPVTVFAYFPETLWAHGTYTSYARIGQHSGCHPDYVSNLQEATEAEYSSLQDELVGLGYTLIVLNKA